VREAFSRASGTGATFPNFPALKESVKKLFFRRFAAATDLFVRPVRLSESYNTLLFGGAGEASGRQPARCRQWLRLERRTPSAAKAALILQPIRHG
jgi:hypothetical protein